jgi:hypothetical protein
MVIQKERIILPEIALKWAVTITPSLRSSLPGMDILFSVHRAGSQSLLFQVIPLLTPRFHPPWNGVIALYHPPPG